MFRDSVNREKEIELINDRQNRFKRKRKIQETGLTVEQTSISELMSSAKEIDDDEDNGVEPCENLQNKWEASINKQKVNEGLRTVIKDSGFVIDIPIYDTDEELITTGGMRICSIVNALKKVVYKFKRSFKKECRLMTYFYEHDIALQKYLKQKQTSVDEVEKLQKDAYKTFFIDYLREKEFAANNISARLAQKCAALCPKQVVARVPRLSQDQLFHYLKKDPSQEKIKRANSTVPNVCEPEKEVFSDSENTSLEDSALGDELDITITNSHSVNSSNVTNDSVLDKPVLTKKQSKSTTLTDLNRTNCTVILKKVPTVSNM